MYCRSKATYNDIRKSKEFGTLPSPQLLQSYKNKFRQHPGVNHEILDWIKREAERNNVSASGKMGGLIIDEISIQVRKQTIL